MTPHLLIYAGRLMFVGLALMTGCTHRPPRTLPRIASALMSTPWCVPVILESGGVEIGARACFAEEFRCEQLRAAAVSHGQIVGVVSVGSCEERP